MKEAEIRLDSSPSSYSARCGGCACVANGNQRERARRPDERSVRGDACEPPLSLNKRKDTRLKYTGGKKGGKNKTKTKKAEQGWVSVAVVCSGGFGHDGFETGALAGVCVRSAAY